MFLFFGRLENRKEIPIIIKKVLKGFSDEKGLSLRKVKKPS